MNLPFCPKSDWVRTEVKDLPAWPVLGRVGLDCETRDRQLTKGGPSGRGLGPGVRRDGKVVGISFAIEDGPGFYLPIIHANGRNMDPAVVLAYMQEQARNFKGEIVGANLPYDLDYLAQMGILFLQAKFRDVQVAEPLLDELRFSYSLNNIAAAHNLPGKDETLLLAAAQSWGVDPKGGLWELPPEHVAPYAIHDAVLPLQILRRQERQLSDADLMGVWDIESKLLLVLLKMRRRGVKINFDKLDQVNTWAMEREVAALSKINHLRGTQLTTDDTTKASALGPVLADLGLDVPMTAKTGKHSVKNEWLRGVNHPVAAAMIEAKKFNKLRNTFVKSILAYQTNGRIHCTLRQGIGEDDSGDEGGARYGRLSCKDPNLQQQPARDPEIGPIWRAIYEPDGDGFWVKGDYSSQEPRITCHYAAESHSPGGAEMVQRYIDNPRLDYHQTIADIMGVERKPAKTIGLGLNYGMGQGKLCLGLGLPTELKSFKKRNGEVIEYLGAGPEGMALLDKYHAAVPYASNLSKRAKRKAAKVGYVKTWDGRRCRFPESGRKDEKYNWTEKALSRIVQGSAAGQMRKAMVDADEAGHKLQLQVHDELNKTSHSEKDAREMGRIMVDAVQFRVPMVVDIETGPNWGNLTTLPPE